MLSWLWLIPVFPAAGALINGIFGKRFPKTVVHWIACGMVFLSFAVAVGCVVQLASMDPAYRVYEKNYYNWIPGGNAVSLMGKNAGTNFHLDVPMGFLLDPLSAVMILVVTGVGFLMQRAFSPWGAIW